MSTRQPTRLMMRSRRMRFCNSDHTRIAEPVQPRISSHVAPSIRAAYGSDPGSARLCGGSLVDRDDVLLGRGDELWRGHHRERGLDGRDRVEAVRSEEHTSELQSRENLVCRLLLEKKKTNNTNQTIT